MDWGAFTWPTAFLLVAGLIALLTNARVQQYLDQRAKERQADQECDRITAEAEAQKDIAVALERQNAAALTAGTLEERQDAEKAKLLREAADDRVAAEIAAELKPDRLVVERKALEAYTEGRLEAERKRGLTAGAIDSTRKTDFELLMEAYRAYRDTGGTKDMASWLQYSNIAINNGKVNRNGG